MQNLSIQPVLTEALLCAGPGASLHSGEQTGHSPHFAQPYSVKRSQTVSKQTSHCGHEVGEEKWLEMMGAG